MEIDIASIWPVVKAAGIVVLIPVCRSVSAWGVKALKDNRVTLFEWRQLAQTVIRVGTMGLMGFVGLNVAGVDNALVAAAIGSFFVDKLFNALKQSKPIR